MQKATYKDSGVDLEIYAESNNLLRRELAMLTAAAAAAFIIAWFMGMTVLVGPVNTLVQAARSLAGGNLAARSSLVGLSGEMGRLAAAFDETAAALETRNQELVNAKIAADDLVDSGEIIDRRSVI